MDKCVDTAEKMRQLAALGPPAGPVGGVGSIRTTGVAGETIKEVCGQCRKHVALTFAAQEQNGQFVSLPSLCEWCGELACTTLYVP